MELGHSELQMKFQSWWWRNLSKVCDEGTKVGWFQGVGWKIGVGDKARFWEDAWVDSNNPKTMFPRLYIIYLDQGKKVGEVGVWEESGWCWRLRWRRERFVWESVLVQELEVLITTTTILKEEKDVQV